MKTCKIRTETAETAYYKNATSKIQKIITKAGKPSKNA